MITLQKLVKNVQKGLQGLMIMSLDVILEGLRNVMYQPTKILVIWFQRFESKTGFEEQTVTVLAPK